MHAAAATRAGVAGGEMGCALEEIGVECGEVLAEASAPISGDVDEAVGRFKGRPHGILDFRF